eukprot:172845-Chlamydomonas_euryale.AAC.1
MPVARLFRPAVDGSEGGRGWGGLCWILSRGGRRSETARPLLLPAACCARMRSPEAAPRRRP